MERAGPAPEEAVAEAARCSPRPRTPIEVSGSRVTPGTAGELRNDLPTTLIVLLALLTAAALAATAPFARRHATTPFRALRRVLPGRTA